MNDEKGIKRLVELLGGHWGKTGLERRYSDAEKALYQCSQLGDESHDSSCVAGQGFIWVVSRPCKGCRFKGGQTAGLNPHESLCRCFLAVLVLRQSWFSVCRGLVP